MCFLIMMLALQQSCFDGITIMIVNIVMTFIVMAICHLQNGGPQLESSSAAPELLWQKLRSTERQIETEHHDCRLTMRSSC